MPADNIWYFSRVPDDPVQRIVVPPEAGDSILVVPSPVVSNPKPANELFQKALQVAGKEVDDRISLSTNRDRVTEYLSLFVDPPPASFYANYCEAGLTWAVCNAYCLLNGITLTDANRLNALKRVRSDINQYYFLTSAYVPDTMNDTIAPRDTFLSDPAAAKAGYLAFFNWGNDNTHPPPFPQHIGFVESLADSKLNTVEFNTSRPDDNVPGAVARKSRDLKFVVGYAKTY